VEDDSKYDVRTWCKVEPDLYKSKAKNIRRFYQHQNQLIEKLQSFYNRSGAGGNGGGGEEEQEEEEVPEPRPVAVAIHGSFGLNVVLLAVKIVASVMSRSMAVIASAADSLLDLLSGTVLVVTHWIVQRRRSTDNMRYPQGKSRIEPIGVFAFAIIMMLSSLQIIIEAVRRFFTEPDIDVGPVTLTILAFTILSKAFMCWYCRRVGKTYRSGAAAAYGNDHRNDVLTNCVGVGTALAAYYVPTLWFLDGTGAICIALYIITCWLRTGNEQLGFLTGQGASPMLLQQLTYISANHDPRIKFVDTVRAYHFGVNYLVEVDIGLPEDMSLKESHDIAESLQHRLEQFEDVERAFVHNDYEWEHSPVVVRGSRIIRS
jgi:cation diffusion facilitator family transporter